MAKKQEEYREQTLEDRQGPVMGKTQKVVIGAALLFLVCFVVYVLVF